MKWARYYDASTGLDQSDLKAWKRVHANNYDLEIHGRELRCGFTGCHPECAVPVYYSPLIENTNGAVVDRPARFSTMPGESRNHLLKQKAISPSGDFPHRRNTANTRGQALEKRQLIGIYYGDNLPGSLNGVFRSAADLRNSGTEMAIWGNENLHFSIRVNSMEEFNAEIQKIVEIAGAHYLTRVHVSYGQKRDCYHDFVNKAANPETEQHLWRRYFKDLIHGPAKRHFQDTPAKRIGRARAVDFTPTDRTRRGEGKYINGNPMPALLTDLGFEDAHRNAKVIVLFEVKSPDPELEAKLRADSKTHDFDFMCTPEINKADIEKTVRRANAIARDFENGRITKTPTVYLKVGLEILSDNQIMRKEPKKPIPAAKAEPKKKKTVADAKPARRRKPPASDPYWHEGQITERPFDLFAGSPEPGM